MLMMRYISILDFFSSEKSTLPNSIIIKVEDPNNQQSRINTIEALSHLATNINLECANVKKSIPSNCGEPNPKNVKECTKSSKKGK